MPRKSKYQTGTKEASSSLWHAALYVRLSREDGDKEESDSVANQRELLTGFVRLEADIEPYDTYTDDGYSGTNFERPAFRRMMEDIQNRAVNCVIVKDLSRFGRNYIEVGQYIEKIFPFLNVRFISVNDMLDSVKNPQAMNNLIVPFKNIINDEYCRDISNKVRSSLDLKRRQGKFIGSFAAYGYRKDPEDHHHLVIDEEAAAVVRQIFQWFVSGTSILGIARRLNGLGIPNPTAYKKGCGLRYTHSTGDANDGFWPDSSVRRILKNQVYTGCLVQGKNRIKSYKLKVCEAVPRDKWLITPNAHEPIIDRELFEKAQSLFERDMRASPRTGQVALLAGLMKCADCGRAMNRKLISQPNREYFYYICSTFKKMNKGACAKHSIRSDRVEEIVLETLRRQIDVAVEMDSLIARMSASVRANRSNQCLMRTLAQKENEKASLEKMKLALYPDWKNGDLTREEYQQLRADFDRRIAGLEETLARLRQESTHAGQGVDGSNAFLSAFIKYRNLEKLSREVVVELIDAIYVHEDGSLTIQFRFTDAFEQAVQYIRQNRQLEDAISG